MCKLHRDYFNDSSPTDCISFPIDNPVPENYSLMGDVFVCPETALIYSEKHKVNPYQEITLYIVHGLLHLMGYDDIELADQEKKCVERKKSI